MPNKYTIGLLSGTSVDAIDGILISWDKDRPSIICTETIIIPEKLRLTVFDLAQTGQNEIEKIQFLDQEFAYLFAQAATNLCKKAELSPKKILAIGSHGQTIRHYPPTNKGEKFTPGFSLQIGDPNIIAEIAQITTVADFRRRDIAAGGHGAPLAPSIHSILFKSNKIDRFIINAGGIANITYLPKIGEPIGFDTGPANGLMDSWCKLNKGEAYDKNGQWATSGKSQKKVVEALLSHPYFLMAPPKSTGPEEFNLNWVQQKLTDLKSSFLAEDIQASLLNLSTETIARAIEEVSEMGECEIYLCGGGAHNQAFCDQLKQRLSPKVFATTDLLGIEPDWVEAVCFAWIAKQTIELKPSNLPSVTGAKRNVILGGIYPI